MRSIADALRETAQILSISGVPEARREAASLLSFVLGRDRTFLISHSDHGLNDPQVVQFRAVVERRAGGEPLQYITGVQDFFGREFMVTPDVLIPRPETELLVETALQAIGGSATTPLVCDVGTGSGCIAVTLLCELPQASVIALDKSPAALKIAEFNSRKHAVAERIEFVVSDCFAALDFRRCQFDLIASNPPYIPADDLPGLQREVRDHEPLSALSPGPDGLSVIRRLLQTAAQFLKEHGHLIMEIGFDQAEAVRGLIDANVWELIEIRLDLQNIPRIVRLRKK